MSLVSTFHLFNVPTLPIVRWQLTLLFFLCCANLSLASSTKWHIIKSSEQATLPGEAFLKSVTLGEVATVEKKESQEAVVTAIVFQEKAYQLEVIDNPARDKSLAQIMQEEHCLAGINGAYFLLNGQPLGLVMSQGKIIHPQQTTRLLSGFVVIEKKKLQLLRSGEKIPAETTGALQAGPFLIDNQVPVAGLEKTKIARRTFIATDGHALWMIGIISPVSLAKAAQVLSAAAPKLFPAHLIQRALNLDGGSSSALWAGLLPEPFSQSEIGYVRNFLGIKLQ